MRIRVVLLLALLCAASLTPARVHADDELRPPSRVINWLNLGDSYGAGEGATKAAGYCQRSSNAGGPKGAAILQKERGWRIDASVFSACTGYWAADLLNSRNELQNSQITLYEGVKPPKPAPNNVEISNDDSLDDWAARQGARPARYDVITASFSGNDIGFADVVTGCTDIVRNLGHGAAALESAVTPSVWGGFALATVTTAAADAKDPEGCGPVVNELTSRIHSLFVGDPYPSSASSPMAGARGNLTDIYRAVAKKYLAPGGIFIVMGYPRLMVPSSDWGKWRGGQCNMLSAQDADALGTAAEYYDSQMRDAVEGIGSQFRYLSRLEVFDDGGDYHSLCGRGVEWLNTPLLFLRDGTARKERGFHPNDLGYLATGEAVAGIVEQKFGVAPTPDTTVPQPHPTVRSSEPHFDIGDPFNDQCTIAWPTAPYRSRSSIEMRTSCGHVPSQFLFVDISYGDPDLPVSPSRSTMQVKGRIVDIARSEFGFTVLVVDASHIEIL